ncbi:MAG: AMP-binding protein [Proteobacteria bacterium]|nr:AMP-binding protein [Pseudomonadota bacterium]MBU1686963.1 AMP-binding protein [Pseudomonadota bacterium]
MAISPAPSLNALIEASCETFADRPALGFAFQKSLTYKEMQQEILKVAVGLRKAGIGQDARVAILAESSPRWSIAYFGVVWIGAVVIPILPDFTESDVLHILRDAGAEAIFTTGKQLEKLTELTGEIAQRVITLDDADGPDEIIKTITFTGFVEGHGDETPLLVEFDSDHPASIIYTSGTSGHSKAVVLSHGNLAANVESARGLVEIKPDWTFLSVLPISHTYEFTVGLLLPLRQGARVVYCDKRPTPLVLEKICAAEHPTVMCVVPMIMEKIYKKKILPTLKKSKVLQILLGLPFLRALVLTKIGRKLKGFFGGQLELMAIGGAALNIEVERFLKESNFPYLVGYGLTETSPLLAGGPAGDPTIALGSCGKPVPGVSIKIVDPNPISGVGAIYGKGPNVMKGYFNNHNLTAETIDHEGWLATGDLGRFDELGNLHITGRSKSLIVLSHGENIYPETLEEKFNSSIYVSESLVTESKDQLTATIVPDYEAIDLETTDKSEEEKLAHIHALLKEIKISVNLQLPTYSQIHHVVERQEPFIKTATQKIKRYLYTASS